MLPKLKLKNTRWRPVQGRQPRMQHGFIRLTAGRELSRTNTGYPNILSINQYVFSTLLNKITHITRKYFYKIYSLNKLKDKLLSDFPTRFNRRIIELISIGTRRRTVHLAGFPLEFSRQNDTRFLAIKPFFYSI